MSIYSHPDLKDLMPKVEMVPAEYNTVTEPSEMLLKHRHPGVVGIRRTPSGQWAGTLITEKVESK